MQRRRSRRFLRFIFLTMRLAALTSTFGALAAGLSYRVDIDAPEPLRKLLIDHLRIVALKSETITLDQLRGAYRRTPLEIEELAATEGYFTPKISSSLRPAAEGWIARFV